MSQQSATIFNGHGIRKINASLLSPTRNFIHVHSKPIRDMTFHPVEHNLIATASLDKFVKLVDLISETVISSIEGISLSFIINYYNYYYCSCCFIRIYMFTF